MAVVSSSPPNPEPGAATCPRCGCAMPSTTAFCPGCGLAMRSVPIGDRLAAALAYLTLLPAAVLLWLPAFRGRRFVRFHAWQSVLLWGLFFLLTVVALLASNVAAALLLLVLGILGALAMFFLWVVLSLKAFQGERFALPIFGAVAGRLP